MIKPLDLAYFKKIFYQEAKSLYAERRKKFEVDSENKRFLELFCQYFTRDESLENQDGANLDKGLFIYGNPGSGKTTSLKILQRIAIKYKLSQIWLPMIETSEVVQKYNINRNKEYIIEYYSKGNFIFDDLGAETHANNIYVFGKEDIFIRIIEARYNDFIERGIKTHISSNLTIDEINKRYGPRVADRFYEMFNLLPLYKNGDSRR
eukprot:TRINITY_DN3531_c0_g1_i1.p1 TRINITY_DN3531_c0_g1~~TRINITY_DN3531_c0_g1_i1.p1  ORF type:complete len:221 (+),score=35.86 TRINITY_DN3531_c0_g1_i1:44-664(+)